jgi:RimJ/RimL family protein N-acetyltransferase
VGDSGSRLVLRTLTARDAELMLADPDPDPDPDTGPDGDRPRFVDGYPSAFATQVLRLVALYPAHDQPTGTGTADLGPWLVSRCADGAVIGTLSCARSAEAGEVSVGYDIARSCRGEGYATEALGAAVEHLLGLPEIERVCAETLTDHTASRRVMEKAGLCWRHDEVVEQDGHEVTLAHYAIERPASG